MPDRSRQVSVGGSLRCLLCRSVWVFGARTRVGVCDRKPPRGVWRCRWSVAGGEARGVLLGSQGDGGSRLGGCMRGEERDEVHEDEDAGDGEEEYEGWDRGGGGDADTVGDESPHESADEQPGGHADDEADGREGGGLPGDGGAYLSAVEPEGFEEGEVAAAAAYGGDERVADGEERESGEERGEGGGEPVDLAEAVDFRGNRGSGRAGEVRVGGDAMLDRGPVDVGGEADEEIAAGVVGVEDGLKSRLSEYRAVREGLAGRECGEHDLSDDPVLEGRL